MKTFKQYLTEMNREGAMKVLSLSPNFTEDELKIAYREAAKKHHPDMGGTLENMQRVTEAHQVLIDEIAINPRPSSAPVKTARPSRYPKIDIPTLIRKFHTNVPKGVRIKASKNTKGNVIVAEFRVGREFIIFVIGDHYVRVSSASRGPIRSLFFRPAIEVKSMLDGIEWLSNHLESNKENLEDLLK